jgi:hypothetical protein
MADDYISEFVGKQKIKSEKERAERDESLKAAKIVLQQKVQVDEQAPATWDELSSYIRQKVSDINAATNGNQILSLDAPKPEELTLQSETRFLTLLYNRDTHVIQIEGGFGTKRTWHQLQAVTDGDKVRFAEPTTKGFLPLTNEEIMKGLLTSFET